LLDFDVTILEDRPEFADPARFGGAAQVLGGHIPDTLASLDFGWSGYIVVATRGHKLDGDCVLSAVERRRATSDCSAAGAKRAHCRDVARRRRQRRTYREPFAPLSVWISAAGRLPRLP
jgi:xanthine dehydrogenase accessory factor